MVAIIKQTTIQILQKGKMEKKIVKKEIMMYRKKMNNKLNNPRKAKMINYTLNKYGLQI